MAKKAKRFYTPHESQIQNGIYLLVIVAICLILWPLAPKPNHESVGILLPQGVSYPAINPNDVQIVANQPAHATYVGAISTKIYFNAITIPSDDKNTEKDLNLAKQLAASYGANILVINQIGRTMELGPLDGFMVYAGAYHD